MKILLCAQDHEKSAGGGPDIWIRNLANFLKSRGMDVTFCFFYFGKIDNCRNIQNIKNDGLLVECISFDRFKYTDERVREFLKVVSRLDIDVIVGNLCIPVLFANKYLKKYNIPVVGVLHGSDPFYEGIIEEFIWKNRSWTLDYVVAVSKYLTRMANARSKTTLIETISCGPSLPNEIKREEHTTLNIVFIGRFHNGNKRVLDVVEAMCYAANLNPNIKAFLYGDGPELENIKSIIYRNNCQDKVLIKGFVDNTEIYNELKDKDVITLLSKSEGMPIALMEGMACGLVPVCKRLERGINEIIAHEINGFLIDGSKESFFEHISKLYDNPDLRKKLGSEARKTIIEGYSGEINHNQWLQFLEKIHEKHATQKKEFKVPKKIKLPKKNLKINEDVRGPKPPSALAVLRKKIGIRTRLKRLFK